MGLLDYLVATAIDGDYAAAAEAKRADPAADQEPESPVRRHGWTAVTLALFALLVAVAAVQSARAAPTREQSRASLVSEAQTTEDDLRDARADVARLRRQVAALDADRRTVVRRTLAASAGARRLGGLTGTVPVTGAGMVVTVDDAPDATSDRERVYDQDLQKLVNGLWAAGAEAISINGQRLSSLSAIRLAGQAITVNFRSLRRPYVVSAIGNPDELPARFVDTAGGTWWLNLKAVYGLRFELTSADTLRLPAISPPLLRFAEVVPPDDRDARDQTDPTPEPSGGSS
jgi:uncharacterized protein YlxW (UPF0749 family)